MSEQRTKKSGHATYAHDHEQDRDPCRVNK
jgi:hypothetical protein